MESEEMTCALREKCIELGLRVSQAALLLQVSPSTCRRWMRSGVRDCRGCHRVKLFLAGALDDLARELVSLYHREVSWQETAQPFVQAWYRMRSQGTSKKLSVLYWDVMKQYLERAWGH